MGTLKTLFRNDMSVDSRGYSPSSKKPAMVIKNALQYGLPIEIIEFEAATFEDLCIAHCPLFINEVLELKRYNGHGNREKEVTESCLLTVGSILAATKIAVEDGVAFSPTSGFHHAGFDHCAGFCTFNGLVVAAGNALTAQQASRVGIIDCDYHYGDGTVSCLERCYFGDRVEHWSFGDDENFGSVDRVVQDRASKALERVIEGFAKKGVDLILYQAGADPWLKDPLGGNMTKAQLRHRDATVFRLCRDLGIPVVWNLAGGYAEEFDNVLDIHRATIEECVKCFSGVFS